jgi:Domain of unknown function (DUF4390)
MNRAILFVLIILLLIVSVPSEAQEISGPEVRVVKNDIYVTFSLKLDDERVQEIRNGLDKNLKFYVDLFRVWNVWPDEFVLGKVFAKTLKSDPIKKEYVATSFDGSTLIQKKFRTFESMLTWTLGFSDVRLANTRELQTGQYFVRITVESKIRKLPPVIGQFMFFVSENEFKIKKDSPVFAVEGRAR